MAPLAPTEGEKEHVSWHKFAADPSVGSVAVERQSAEMAAKRKGLQVSEIPGLRPQLVCPGDTITAEPGSLRGHGILERPEDGKLVATTCGIVEQVNKLLYVKSVKHRYKGNVGDVVIGRITEVLADRWAVEIGTAMLAYLHIGSIQLPGNVQRRRTDEDILRMREFFEENDVISAEVQKVSETGELSLQTRNARYGKLQNGVLCTIPSCQLRRQAQHFVTLPNIGVQASLGMNGMVWVCKPSAVIGSGRQETINFSQMDVRYEEVQEEFRGRICRVRNAIVSLANFGLEVTPDSITFVYDKSLELGLAPWELLDSVRCSSAGLLDALLQHASGEKVTASK